MDVKLKVLKVRYVTKKQENVLAYPNSLLEEHVTNVKRDFSSTQNVKVILWVNKYASVSQLCVYFSYVLQINFLECKCNIKGSKGEQCDEPSGKCICKLNVVGDKCKECEKKFYKFPDCLGTCFSILDRHQVWRSHDPTSVQTFDFCEKWCHTPFFKKMQLFFVQLYFFHIF